MSKKKIYRTATLLMIGCLFLLFIVPALYNAKVAKPLSVVLVLGILSLYGIRFFSYLKSNRGQKSSSDLKQHRSRLWVSLLIFGVVFCCGFVVLSDLYARSLSIYQDATRALLISNTSRSVLGESIEIGWPVKADLRWYSSSEYAALEIPVSGNSAKGVLCVIGTKANGEWKADEMYLILQGSSQRLSIMSSEAGEKPVP